MSRARSVPVRSPSLFYPCAKRRGCWGVLTEAGRYEVGFHLIRNVYLRKGYPGI